RVAWSPVVLSSRSKDGLQCFLDKRNCNHVESSRSRPREAISRFCAAQLYSSDDKILQGVCGCGSFQVENHGLPRGVRCRKVRSEQCLARLNATKQAALNH